MSDESKIAASDLAEETLAAQDGDETEGRAAGSSRSQRAVFGVPVQVVVSVGSARPTIGELLSMQRDALLPLDSKLDDPVDIMIGKRVVARGELQELEDADGRLGVRLTEIVDLGDTL